MECSPNAIIHADCVSRIIFTVVFILFFFCPVDQSIPIPMLPVWHGKIDIAP